MTGLFDLSYEKLVKLRDEATGFWSELHEDTRKYLEQVIESEEAWQEVQETRKEAMTGISFESVRSSFWTCSWIWTAVRRTLRQLREVHAEGHAEQHAFGKLQ